MTLGEIIARRRCAFTTRGNILAAARKRFLAESYENVGLRGEDDGDEQLVGVARFQLGHRIRRALGEAPVEFGDVGLLHPSPSTSCIV